MTHPLEERKMLCGSKCGSSRAAKSGPQEAKRGDRPGDCETFDSEWTLGTTMAPTCCHWGTWRQVKRMRRLLAKPKISGWERIRTPGGLSPTAVFKTAALDHSATHPNPIVPCFLDAWHSLSLACTAVLTPIKVFARRRVLLDLQDGCQPQRCQPCKAFQEVPQ